MQDLLKYILQVNLLLTLILIGYNLLLKNMTFHVINRIYFVVGTCYAFLYPIIDFNFFLPNKRAINVSTLLTYISPTQVQELSNMYYSVNDFVLIGIALGVVFFIVKLCIQLFSLVRIHYYSRQERWHDYLFRNVFFPIVPFSFFNSIYVHQAQHKEKELHDIFGHETIHVKGWHTLDILLFEMVWIICWYNPFIRLMRKVVRQNLEFLTDQQVLRTGADRQAYQYSLLHVVQQGASIEIGNQFNFKILKKRILMMNKKPSSKLQLSKYAFLLPVLLIAGSTFTVSHADGKLEAVAVLAKETALVQKTELLALEGNNKIEYPKQEIGQVAHKETKSKLENPVLYLQVNKDTVSIEKSSIKKDTSSFTINRLDLVKVDSSRRVKDELSYKGKEGAMAIQDRQRVKTSTETFISFDKPIIFIDGVEMKNNFDINRLNPDDIKSITVMKDTSLIQVYGEKARNGAIFIIRKKQ